MLYSPDGKHRVHKVVLDGHERLRIERRGLTQAISGPQRECWYFVHDARNVQEVARHVDLSTLSERSSP
jgi:hypothetical protein